MSDSDTNLSVDLLETYGRAGRAGPRGSTLLSRLGSAVPERVRAMGGALGGAVPKRVRAAGGGAVEAVKMKLSRRADKAVVVQDEQREEPEESDPDWWTRYYATAQARAEGGADVLAKRVHVDFHLKIYPSELESQPEFESFQDFLHVLPLCRGKVDDEVLGGDGSDDDDDDDPAPAHWAGIGKVLGRLKVAMELWRLPDSDSGDGTTSAGPASAGLSAGMRARPLAVVVRVYVVRALALPPRDANGSCDPYLFVKLGRQRRRDSEYRVAQSLNPIFGRVFELEAEFPRDHAVTVRLMDWDATGRDDVIGETTIDLENRVLSRHMGGCGLQKRFTLKGNNRWRDSRLPSELLAEVAAHHGLPAPRFEGGTVAVGDWTTTVEVPPEAESPREHVALCALHAWPGAPRHGCALVPQHVETRSLYHPRRPGIEQGQLELWVDVLVRDAGTLPMPPAVPLAPPLPSPWELRVVVLEAASVVGTERLLLSKDKSSDVYVKGWMSGLERDAQSTDVHYACLSGEALWTWRMVFRFEHIWPENRVVTDGTQGRHPPRLHLALMDYDTFTRDDLLGTLSLDLSRLPRGSSFSANCKAPGKETRPTVNLFLARHATGWWPALLAPDVTKGRSKGIGGKLKLELSLMPAVEADRDPAGVGHEGPQALPKPQRPVEAFSMLRHPVMGLYHFVWRRHRRMLLCAVLVFLVAIFVLVAVYSLPGYIVKKAIGA